jgi:hypothetical protein
MTIRFALAPLTLAALALAVASPVSAAMPAGPGARTVADSPIVQVAEKTKKTRKMTRRQEIDRSVESGTVPRRYRSSVPKAYHQYIPFSKQ